MHMCGTRGISAFPMQHEPNDRREREASAVTPERPRAFGVVRCKDNKTIKSQIRGQLVRVSEPVASARSREGVAIQKKNREKQIRSQVHVTLKDM